MQNQAIKTKARKKEAKQEAVKQNKREFIMRGVCCDDG